MAIYQDTDVVKQLSPGISNDLLGAIYESGDPTVVPGIYRCVDCGMEYAIPRVDMLDVSHQCPVRKEGRTRFRLTVQAEQKPFES